MNFLTHKLATVLLTAHFALLGCGSVVLHQVTGEKDCQCHQHLALETPLSESQPSESQLCDCPEHTKPEQDGAISEGSKETSQHECALCQFFEQRMDSVDSFDLTIHYSPTQSRPLRVTRFIEPESVETIFARGPPRIL